MGFLRRYFRRVMNPLEPEYATRWRNRFRLLYFLGAWNFFAYVIYVYVKETKLADRGEGETSVEYYSRLLQKQDATVYRYTDGKLVEEVKLPPVDRPVGLPWMKPKSEKQLPSEDLELLVEETNSL